MEKYKDARDSKLWPHFVNLYRDFHGTNAGLEGAFKFDSKKLKECIFSFQRMDKSVWGIRGLK